MKEKYKFNLGKHRFQTPFAELDAIMKNESEEVYYIIEVKSLSSKVYLEQSIHANQILRIQRAAQYLISRFKIKVEIWFCVVYPDQKVEVFKNIF